jgi:hypothetical protein
VNAVAMIAGLMKPRMASFSTSPAALFFSARSVKDAVQADVHHPGWNAPDDDCG